MASIAPFEVSGLDYSKGPNGEPIIEKDGTEGETGKPVTYHGFKGSDGSFVLHGARTVWYERPTANSKGRKEQEVPFFDGSAHGLLVEWFRSGEKSGEKTFKHGKGQGRCVSFFRDGKVEGVFGYDEDQHHGPSVG